MTSIVLVPWANTDWGEAGRMAARTPLPLNDSGLKQAAEWANELAGRELRAVYCAEEATSKQVAQLLASRAEVRLKTVSTLEEVDVGLWEGLTSAQVESRFPKIYKRWLEDPSGVCPPDGELLGDAAQRVYQAITKIARKHNGSSVAVVLGPIALAATRSQLEHGAAGRLHHLKANEPVWYQISDATAPQPASAPTP
ncbi:MAG: histidine phosphatase family protein [Phycisphaerae bacterium]